MPAHVPIVESNVANGVGAALSPPPDAGWSVGTTKPPKCASTRAPPGKSIVISMERDLFLPARRVGPGIAPASSHLRLGVPARSTRACCPHHATEEYLALASLRKCAACLLYTS